MGSLKIQGGGLRGRDNMHCHEYLKSSYLKCESGEISFFFCQLGARGEAKISAGGWRGLFSSLYIRRLFHLDFSEVCHTGGV